MKLFVLLGVVAFISSCSCVLVAHADGTSGQCGDNINWTYDESSRKLTINGTGDMYNYKESDHPFDPFTESIETIVFKGDVTSVGRYAFARMTNLSSVTLPSTANTIEGHAFLRCTSLTSITLPESAYYFDAMAFIGCSSLSEFSVDENNMHYSVIEGVLFNKTGKHLEIYPPGRRGSYTIPNTVEEIMNYAFYQNEFLDSVTIPDSVTYIHASVFYGCTSLTSVTIPASVSRILEGAFAACPNLMRIDVDEKNDYFKSIDGVLFTKDETQIYQYPCGKKGPYTVPDGVYVLRMSSFKYCDGLTSVLLPASLNTTLYYCFRGCSNLELVSFLGTSDPHALGAFLECDNLRAICVPNDYSASRFCELDTFCKRDSCADVLNANNQCYQAVCEDGEWKYGQRENVTEWEQKENDCASYQCDNDIGLVVTNKCKESGQDDVCIDNQCTESGLRPNNKWKVIITMQDNVYDEVNTTIVSEIVYRLTGMKPTEDVVEIDMDADGHITRVVIYDDNESVAEALAERVNKIDKGDDCSYGVFCHSKEAKKKSTESSSSSSESESGSGEQLRTSIVLCLIMLLLTMAAY